MKKTALLTTLILTTASFSSFGQLYEKIYEVSNSQIQDKINQNKISGIDILTGINAQHVVGLVGLNISQKSNLEQYLSSVPLIFSYLLTNDLSSVVIQSGPAFSIEDFTLKIEAMNGVITGKSTTYYIN